MDALSLTIHGHVGSRIRGLYTDRFGRDCYEFTMACNFRHGAEQSTLWANILVRGEPLLPILLQRGIYQGDCVLVMSQECTQRAAMVNGQPRAYLDVLCQQLVFTREAARPDALVKYTDGKPRILNFADIEKAG